MEHELSHKVVIVNTGGTIAMNLDETTNSVQVGLSHPLRSIEAVLRRVASYEMVDLFNVPSPHMTPVMMHELSRVIRKYLEQPDVLGVVVTHGTDTLEETAYYLDLTIRGDKPVVITGAMRSSNELGADGPVNLVQSLRVAEHESSRGRGVLVVFNDEIHAARHVTKTHTSNVATFQSPSYGPVGIVTKKDISYHQPPDRVDVFEPQVPQAQVPVVKMVAGMDPKWLQFLFDAAIDGVVLEAFGAGNVSPPVLSVLRKLREKAIPVVMVSRCYNGYVQDIYGYEGGGKQLKDLGIVFCNGLNGQKARIRLMVLLAAGVPADQFSNYF